MSNLTQNVYNIEDLYLVKFKENYKEYLSENGKMREKDGFYFSPDTYYLVERTVIKENFKYDEYYEECITGIDFYTRSDYRELNDIPPIFECVETLPLDYFNESELETHQVTSSRLFIVFQQINFPGLQNKKSENSKILRYGEKVC